MKKIKGIPPKKGKLITSFCGYDFWLTGASNGWLSFKIVSQRPRLKANWRLSYNGERFSQSKCSIDLIEYNQLLGREVIAILDKDFDNLYHIAKQVKEGA
jgi:hypothetical protein